MFTGLVESIGSVVRCERSGTGLRLDIKVSWPDDEAPRQGDSIAVDGACLTTLESHATLLSADVSPETRRCTVLDDLRVGSHVNLERALRLGDRVGGHLVSGHVDAVVRLLSMKSEQHFARWTLSLPPEIAPEIARKGSVTLHGVSLTVADISSQTFEVALIPETLRSTTLQSLKVGSPVHLETDVIAKYVGRCIIGIHNEGNSSSLGGRTREQATPLINTIFGD